MADTQINLLTTHKAALKALEDRHSARAKSVSYHLASRVVRAKATAQDESAYQQAAFKALAATSSKHAAVLRSAHRAGAVTGRHHAKQELEALGLKSPVVPITDNSTYTAAARDALSSSTDAALGKLYDAATPEAAKGHVKELVRRASVAASVVANRAYTDQQLAMWRATASANPDKVFEKVWATNPLSDPCPECLALDGSAIGLWEEFPYDPTDPIFQNDLNGPPRHPNCRCRLVLRVTDANPDPVEAAAAALAAVHLDVDELLELHGHKGQPGYFLLHDPDKKKADAATAIYKVYGQHAVTPSSVANVLEGKAVTGAVPAGTLPAHVTLPGGEKYRLNPGEHAISNENYKVGGTTGIAIVKPNGDIQHYPGTGFGGSIGNTFSPGSSGHKALLNAWKNKIAEHKPVGSSGGDEDGPAVAHAITLPYGGVYDMKPGDKQLGKVDGSTKAVVIQHADGDLTFWTGNNADAVNISEKEDKPFHDKVTELWTKTVAVAPGPFDAPAPKAPEPEAQPKATSTELPNGESYTLMPGDKQLTQHTDGTFDHDAVVVQHADGSITTWVEMGDHTEIEKIPTSDSGHAGLLKYYGHVVAEGPKAAVPPPEKPAEPITGIPTEIPKQGGGTIAVSPDELADAIHTLKTQAGIYVKQPLAKIDHPLQHMDYHAVAALHPEVKAKAGKDKTKQAVIHHLETQLAVATTPPPPPPPTTTSFGGVDNLTVEHLKSAHKALSDAKGIMVKQPLSAANHPLAAMDYHAVAKDHADATGNKLAGKDKTKQNVLGALDSKIKEMEGHGPGTAPEAKPAPPKPEEAKPAAPKKFPKGGDFIYTNSGGSSAYVQHADGTWALHNDGNPKAATEGMHMSDADMQLLNDGDYYKKVPNVEGDLAEAAAKVGKPEPDKPVAEIPVGSKYHLANNEDGEGGSTWEKTGDGKWNITYDDGTSPQDVTDLKDSWVAENSSMAKVDSSHFIMTPNGSKWEIGDKFDGNYFAFAGDGPYTVSGISKHGAGLMVHFKNAAGEDKSANETYFETHATPIVSPAAKAAGDTSYYIEAPNGSQYHKNADGTWQYVDANGVMLNPSASYALSFEKNALNQGWKKVEKGNPGDPAEAVTENEPGHLVSKTGKKYYPNGDGTWKVVGPDGTLINPASSKTSLFEQKALDAGWTKVGETSPPKPVPEEPETPIAPKAKATKKAKAGKDAITGADLLDKWPLAPPGGSYTASALSAQYKQYIEQLGLKNYSIGPGFIDKSNKQAWLNAVYKGDFGKAYQIELSEWKWKKSPKSSYGSVVLDHDIEHPHKDTHPGSPDNPLNHGQVPAPIATPAAVDGEVPAGSAVPGNWPTSIYDLDQDQIDGYMLAAGMKNSPGLTAYQKKTWVQYHMGGNKLAVDQLSVQAQKNYQNGNYYTEEITPPKPVIPVGQVVPQNSDWKPFNKELNHAINLDDAQTNDYLSNLLSNKALAKAKKQDLKVRQAIVQQHWLAGNLAAGDEKDKAYNNAEAVLGELEASAAGGYEPNLPVFGEKHSFTLKPDQPNLPGFSKKSIVVDEHGKEWLFKYDKEGGWRSEVENTAHNAGNFFGFGTAPAQVGKFNGSAGLFQAVQPNDGDVHDIAPHTLTLLQQKDVAAEHLLDWALDNDDAHNQNFLILPNGHAFGIDKGRAWKHLGSANKSHTLDWPSGMSYNAHLYYEDLYNDISSGKISQEDTDAIYRHVMGRAKAMSRKSDASYRTILEDGLKNRPGYNKALVDAIVARKNGLPEDFDKLWGKVYEKAGWEKPDLAKGKIENSFSGTSPELMDAMKSAQVQGVASFFGGKDLEDAHLLMYETHDALGKGTSLQAIGQLRESGNDALMKWIKTHGGEGLTTYASTNNASPPKPGAEKQSEEWAATVLKAAKTISHHQMDKEYNQSTLNELENLKQLLGDESSHEHVPKDLNPWEFDQYDSMVAFYKGQIEQVEKLKADGGKSKIGEYVPFAWEKLDNPLGEEKDDPQLQHSYKVELKPGVLPGGAVNSEGKLITSPDADIHSAQSTEYVVELPSGAKIHYVSFDHGTVAQQGRIRIEVPKHDGTSGQLDDALDLLRGAGVSLDPAEDRDLELFYWRHVHGIISDRMDGQSGSKYAGLTAAGAAIHKANMSDPDSELDAWHTAFRDQFGSKPIDDWIAKQGYLPRYLHRSTFDAESENGRPYWERFDVGDDQMANQRVLNHSLYHGDDAALGIVLGGQLLPTEERTRQLGKWLGGTSSTGDQSYGSSAFLFTRQNTGLQYAGVVLNPRVKNRTHNYSWNNDHWGKSFMKKTTAPWEWKKATGFSDSGNEMMLKHGVSLMDDIEAIPFSSDVIRQQAIDHLKNNGIHEIRGIPVEERLLPEAGYSAAVQKLLDKQGIKA